METFETLETIKHHVECTQISHLKSWLTMVFTIYIKSRVFEGKDVINFEMKCTLIFLLKCFKKVFFYVSTV